MKINIISSAYNSASINKKTNYLNVNLLNNRFINLQHLQTDAVSFSSRGKQPSLQAKPFSNPIVTTPAANGKLLSAKERTITNHLAQQIFEQAEGDTCRLKSILRKSISGLIPNDDNFCDFTHPVFSLEFRTKSANSIREKASQKYLHTKEGVVSNLHDLVGARIIMGNAQKGCIDKVIDQIIECVRDRKLKIIEVENHIPTDKKYQYVSQTKLRKLAQLSSDLYGIIVPERITRRENGYMGVHLMLAFPDGLFGEIQILGYDVALFKELEDIPYKILQGKSTKKKYAEIARVLSPMLPIGEDLTSADNIERAKLKKEFIAYTTAAYKYEREKPTAYLSIDTVPHFLSIDEFSKMYKRKLHLTPDMDFNNLYKLKMAADYKTSE